MRVFVTGGTGFVGSHFLRQTLAAGHEITAVRRPGGNRGIDAAPHLHWLERALDEVTQADLVGHDVLVHLAAHTANHPYDSLEKCLHWNVTVPLQLFARAHQVGVCRQIAAGSCFEYGRAADRYDFIPTDAPLDPLGTYPASKAAASVALADLARNTGSRLSLLRIFQVFGPGEQPARFWPSLRVAAETGRDFPMSPGEQVRDFIRVEEVAAAFVQELARVVPSGQPEIRHVATGQPQTLLAFASHWWKAWNAPGRLQPGSMPYREGEIMRLVSVPPAGAPPVAVAS
jgi:nucleoside-diphosphate-sugar epimerase